MWIAEARKKTAKKWRNQEITWEQFCKRMSTPLRTAETAREYRAMSKDERDTIKESPGGFVGGFLNDGIRRTANVRERSMITLDADNAKSGAWERAIVLNEWRMCSYTTHSHTELKPRLRWIIPTSRPMTPDEYPAIARKVAQALDIETIDPTTYDLCRLFYYPSCSKDAPYEYHEQDGPLLDPDEVLASYGPGDAWKDTTLWPIAKSEAEVRKTLIARAGEPTEKPGIVGLFCRTYDVPAAIDEFLPDVYLPVENTSGRYTYAKGSTAGGAIVYDNGAFLYSNHATDPAAGRSVNAFDLVRIHKFGELDGADELDVPVTKLPSYEAMSQWAAGLGDVKRQLVAERGAEAEAAFADMIDAPAPAEEEDDADWVSRLELVPRSTDPKPTSANVQLILEHDPALKGRIFLNSFADRTYAEDPLPWTAGLKGVRSWSDRDDAGARDYLEHVWHINSSRAVADALTLSAGHQKRHPVREYLESLTWDGTPRVETMLIDYLGAEDSPLNREIAKRWMVAAVRRIYQPGIKFDTVLVLVSPKQGIGKSQFADILGGEWFQDGLPQIGSKDAMQTLRGAWIIEVNEMAATKKAEDEQLKQFFAARNDRYRESYGRHEVDHPRQCVFVGSTNDREFIVDNTGGRRYWPVDVHATRDDVGPRMDRMRAVRDQLWAEALVLYRKGKTPTYFNEPEFLKELEAQQALHTQEDEWQGLVEAYLDQPLPDDWDSLPAPERRAVIQGTCLRYGDEQRAKWTRRRQTVTIAEIRNELLCEEVIRGAGGNNPSSRHLGKVMGVMPGWALTSKKTPPSSAYGQQKIYQRTSE